MNPQPSSVHHVPQSHQRGFTLVELMIAITILFIIGAISVAAYREYIQTGRDSTLRDKTAQVRMYQESYRIDNGEYLAGVYDPAAEPPVNDLLPIGFRVSGERGDIRLTIEAGDCGDIERCYKVTAEHIDTGRQYIWDNGTESWAN